MRYQIKGETFPVVILSLEEGEEIITQNGGMSWMSSNMELTTSSNGIIHAVGRKIGGEKFFQNIYKPKNGAGYLAVASTFPGKIIPFEIRPNNEIILQKRGFLCAQPNVRVSLWMQNKIRSGLFSGEGFALQKLSGVGMAFAEMDGYVKKYSLAPDEKIVMESGHLAAVTSSCKIDIQTTGSMKNALLSGEGLFNTTVTGPGYVWVQSMPIKKLASTMRPYMMIHNR